MCRAERRIFEKVVLARFGRIEGLFTVQSFGTSRPIQGISNSMDTNDELQELNLLLKDHGMARAAVSDMIDYVYFDFVLIIPGIGLECRSDYRYGGERNYPSPFRTSCKLAASLIF